ncbi:hypothetical protein ACB094_12G114000 [Castanea mollissima]
MVVKIFPHYRFHWEGHPAFYKGYYWDYDLSLLPRTGHGPCRAIFQAYVTGNVVFGSEAFHSGSSINKTLKSTHWKETKGWTLEREVQLCTYKNNDVKLEENPFEQKKRKRTSVIWNDFNEIILPDGTKKIQCIHCLKRLAYSNNGATTQYQRHLKGCLSRKLADKKQKQLAINEGGVESEVAIANFNYDHAKVREKASHVILVHEYPFNMMEHEVFNIFMKTATPYYQKISHNTARNDCNSTFDVNRVSLTIGFWKFGQIIGNMCLTCHFVDFSWKLQKRIINFCDVPPPHSKVVISNAIFKSLLDWGLQNKVCMITLDNANNNDAAVRILKDAIKRKLMLGGKIFHVRCCAHIINLFVQDGLKEIEMVIENVRKSVNYLIASEARLKLILDCPTHWNATYAMLATALEFREVFPRYKDRDAGYNWLPSNEDWDKTEHVCNFLSFFEEVTNVISRSEYPIANIFLLEVWKIKEVLNDKSLDENYYISAMACKVKLKFDKYWGECNFVMVIAAVLNPRFKMTLINFSFPKIYQGFEVARNIDCVHDSLYQLYNEYVVDYTSSNARQSASKSTEGSSSVGGNNSNFKTRGRMEFDQFVRNVDNIQPAKSNLDANNLKFRILSKMAFDILSIPITTVASEFVVSTEGRVIDVYRAFLSTKTVQALLCGSDWVRPLYKTKKQSQVSVHHIY